MQMIRWQHDHLSWTQDGAVWATWTVSAATYPMFNDEQKLALHTAVRDALTALPVDSSVVSVTRPWTARELASAVMTGIPEKGQTQWQKAVTGDVKNLLDHGPVRSRLYLSAQVQQATNTGMFDAAIAELGVHLGTVHRPRKSVIKGAKNAAKEIAARVGRTLSITPTSPWEMAWLRAHATRRGLSTPLRRGLSETQYRIDDVVLHEGGNGDDDDRPVHRRYLRADSADGVSYQTTLMVAEMPNTFHYPGGGEWFQVASVAPFPVDWFARINAVENVHAQTQTKKQQRQLNAQYEQYEGEPAGPPQALALALDGVSEQQAELAARPSDPELHVAIGFTVAASDLVQHWTCDLISSVTC